MDRITDACENITLPLADGNNCCKVMVILEQSKITYSGGYFPQTVNNNLVYLAQAMWYPTYLKYLCERIIGVIVLATVIRIGYSTVGHGNLNLVMVRKVSIQKRRKIKFVWNMF